MIEGLFSSNNYVANKNLLDVTLLRHEALASNIANVETPGYKRMDIPRDFAKEFAKQVKAGEASSITVPKLAQDLTTSSTRMDGNNVEIDKELLEMGENSLQYETLTEFVSSSLRQLRLAITGRGI